jgi:hypothetical protein
VIFFIIVCDFFTVFFLVSLCYSISPKRGLNSYPVALQVPPGQGQFHENPLQCICEKPEAKEMLAKLRSHVDTIGGGNMVSHIEEAKLSGSEFFKGHTDFLADEEEEEDDLPMIIEEYQSKAGEGDFNLEKDKDTDLANNEGKSGT